MIIEKFEAPQPRRYFKFLEKLDYIQAKNQYRACCWEIRRCEDLMHVAKNDDMIKTLRKNLNYLKAQRKLMLDYLM
ncbi:hypothetical protein [Cellulosilyticum sp. WCF-2]|uniref:hypothetical protein n=1 Tax=Cellulosilyticum sp. WCF-2 TaxID=2497860 RepID=UPI000F8E2432|nr:hypothetical protein [Cellulosilyticum sp. WCF-2]QEH68702.1 hypothetical protein EKH84_10055 [Cellulosilyticum sp. WCF-2]